MSVLIIFLIIWIVAPGPIAVLTLNRARSQGFAAGVAIATGAAIMTLLIFGIVLSVTLLNIPILQFSDSRAPQVFGAILIILLGLHAAIKAFAPSNHTDAAPREGTLQANNPLRGQRHNMTQGMLIATSGIPQSIIFYLVLIPQTAAPDEMQTLLIVFGLGKVLATLCWYSFIAGMVSLANRWLSNPQIGRRFDFATAFLMVGVGVNILL